MPKLPQLVHISLALVILTICTSALAINKKIIIELPVSTVKSLPYYAVQLPMQLYPLSTNGQLSDLKIRNARGDFLNYAWLDSTSETLKLESHTLPFFPVFAATKAEEKNQEVIGLDILRQTDGSLIAQKKFKPTANTTTSVRAWIIDASRLNPNALLVQVRIRIDKNFQGIMPLKIEVSNDLKSWDGIGGIDQLIQLKHQGEQIQKLSLNLGYSKAKYIRLNLQSNSDLTQATPQILATEIDTQEQALVGSKMQWTEQIQAHQCSADSCEYNVPANTPIDSLRLHLQEKNTLTKVQIFGEFPTSSKPSTTHQHFRNPLYVLRHQKHRTAPTTTQDIFFGDTTAYRLDLPAGEISTEDFSLSGDTLNKIRLQFPAGVKSLGRLPPTISLGSLSRHLAFLTRGDAPYRIEFSANEKTGTALDLNTLMPKLNLRNVALTFAEVRIESPTAESVTLNISGAKTSIEHSPTSTQRRYLLWAALIAAMTIIGAMVWSLLRNIDKENQ